MFAVPSETAMISSERSKAIALLSKYQKKFEISVFTDDDKASVSMLAKEMEQNNWNSKADRKWFAVVLS